MAVQIGQITAKLVEDNGPARVGARRGGISRGQERWALITRDAWATVIRAAQALETRGKWANRSAKNGKKNGPLGDSGIGVLKTLHKHYNWKTGRCDPATTTIAKDLGCADSTVNEARKRLRVFGFLDWARRYEPAKTLGMRGPQRRQISNAYVPICATSTGSDGKIPLPDDEVQRRVTARAEDRAMMATLPLDEWVRMQIHDDALADVLAPLGLAISRN